MAATASTMHPLGTLAPDFRLPDTSGRLVSRDDFAASPALLVMFLCNHCPYVKHVAEEVVRLSGEYQARGVGAVAISSNDVAQFPEDGPGSSATNR
jgi:peroxiredoxin